MICTLCGSELINKKDAFFYECTLCKALVKDDQHYLSASEEKAQYITHNNDVKDVRFQNFTSPITNYVLANFSSKDKGLDFGSGTGPVISYMLNQSNYNIVQYDPFFAPQINLLENKYDYIVSCEVFEHFYKPKQEINRLISLLNANGTLLIKTVLFTDSVYFKTWYYRNDPTHVFIYRKETIEFIAKEWNLELDVLSDKLIVFKKTA